jgi:hypothetical protein
MCGLHPRLDPTGASLYSILSEGFAILAQVFNTVGFLRPSFQGHCHIAVRSSTGRPHTNNTGQQVSFRQTQ